MRLIDLLTHELFATTTPMAFRFRFAARFIPFYTGTRKFGNRSISMMLHFFADVQVNIRFA